MEPRLSQQQSQKLVLSPQIRQYLRLLQLPVQELSQAVDAEMAENPLLEEKTAASQEDTLPNPGDTSPEAPEAPMNPEEVRLGETFESLGKDSEALPTLYDEDDRSSDIAASNPKDLQRLKDYQESALTKPEALSDYLIWQIRFLDLSPAELEIAKEIIGNINEQGYLQATPEEIAQATGHPSGKILQILEKIQELEPPGIAARDLQEALILQLKRKGEDAKLALEIVTHHFDLLGKRDVAQLAKALGVDTSEVQKAMQVIIRLEPRPGRSFYAEEPIAVSPDAIVTFDPEDESKLKIEIVNDPLPELRIHPYYRRLLRSKDVDPKTRAFLREKLQDALNFINAIKQRKSTLQIITEQIAKDQPEFFEKGFAHLRPLRLKDVADQIGIHESTVSRALNGKYIQTPQGTIPYRSFFSSRLETVDGEAESQKSIQEKIRGLIEKENPQKPLSDQEIVRLLKQDGLMIARRTVAKYRDLLKILPSHLRRNR